MCQGNQDKVGPGIINKTFDIVVLDFRSISVADVAKARIRTHEGRKRRQEKGGSFVCLHRIDVSINRTVRACMDWFAFVAINQSHYFANREFHSPRPVLAQKHNRVLWGIDYPSCTFSPLSSLHKENPCQLSQAGKNKTVKLRF